MPDGPIRPFDRSGRSSYKPGAPDQVGEIQPIVDRQPVKPRTERLATRINRNAQRTARDITFPIASRNSLIPMLLGRFRAVGMVDFPSGFGGQFSFAYTFGDGPINGISLLSIDGRETAITGGSQSGGLANGNLQLYSSLGTTADASALQAWLNPRIEANYIDVPETVRIGFELRPFLLKNALRVEIVGEGELVYDYRTDTTAYSENLALIMAHIVTKRAAYLSVNSDNVAEVADQCDNSTPVKALGLVVNRKQRLSQLLTQLSLYGVDWHLSHNEIIFTHRDARRVSHFIGPNDIIAGSSKLSKSKGRSKKVDGVFVIGYDPDTNQDILESVKRPVLSDRDYSEVKAEGARTASQCLSIALERYNESVLSDTEYSATLTPEKGAKIEAGDLCAVEDTNLGSPYTKEIVAESIEKRADDFYSLIGFEYDPLVWEDAVATQPSGPDTTLPDPDVYPALTVLREMTSPVATFAGDNSTYTTSYSVIWEQPDYAYEDKYIVQLYDAATDKVQFEAIVDRDDLPDPGIGTPAYEHDFGSIGRVETSLQARVAILSATGRSSPFNNQGSSNDTNNTITRPTPVITSVNLDSPDITVHVDAVVDDFTSHILYEEQSFPAGPWNEIGRTRSKSYSSTGTLPHRYRATLVLKNDVASFQSAPFDPVG